MKKLVLITATLLLFAGFTSNAQMMGNDQKPMQQMMMQNSGMMQQGDGMGMMGQGMCPMCGQMMNQNMPMRKCMMLVNRLPGLQQQLSLNSSQVEQLIDLQTEFKKQRVDYQAEMAKTQMKTKDLFENAAPAGEIRKQLENSSDIRINMQVAAYETAQEMKGILNSDQKEQLKQMMMQHENMMGRQGNRMQNRNRMMNPDNGMMQEQMND